LHDAQVEVFVSTPARTTLALVVPVVMVCAFFSPTILLHPHRAPLRGIELPTASSSLPDATVRADDQSSTDDADGTVDLFGNEVTDAVAKYKFDATGSLYELHSPQIELPRLGSPKT
jgi:hypothetical protein